MVLENTKAQFKATSLSRPPASPDLPLSSSNHRRPLSKQLSLHHPRLSGRSSSKPCWLINCDWHSVAATWRSKVLSSLHPQSICFCESENRHRNISNCVKADETQAVELMKYSIQNAQCEEIAICPPLLLDTRIQPNGGFCALGKLAIQRKFWRLLPARRRRLA